MSVLNREELPELQRWNPPQMGEAHEVPMSVPDSAPRPTVRDLEALEEQAREEGYAAGHAEGLAAAQQQARTQVARLEALYASAARPLQSLDQATEQELARLALVVARRVIAHELSSSPERVVEAVRQAAAALPSATRELRVRLHPDDLKLMRELDAAETHWQLLADPAISRGGCRLESERSRLDARLETRISALVDAVLGDDVADANEDVLG